MQAIICIGHYFQIRSKNIRHRGIKHACFWAFSACCKKKIWLPTRFGKEGLVKALQNVARFVNPKTIFQSDMHPYYPPIIKSLFPNNQHVCSKGIKSTVSGQGELKRHERDPLFYINHTLAMLRANINRLIRKTWCTTKDPARLRDHLAIYTAVHNQLLTA